MFFSDCGQDFWFKDAEEKILPEKLETFVSL
jgi:hypothetical protein